LDGLATTEPARRVASGRPVIRTCLAGRDGCHYCAWLRRG